jgi:hypothetical protein
MRNVISIYFKKCNGINGANKSQLWESKAIHIKMRFNNIELSDKAARFES